MTDKELKPFIGKNVRVFFDTLSKPAYRDGILNSVTEGYMNGTYTTRYLVDTVNDDLAVLAKAILSVELLEETEQGDKERFAEYVQNTPLQEVKTKSNTPKGFIEIFDNGEQVTKIINIKYIQAIISDPNYSNVTHIRAGYTGTSTVFTTEESYDEIKLKLAEALQ